MGEWRGNDEDGYIVCDPTLDLDIACLPPEVRRAIWAGKNISHSQAEAIKAALAAEAKKKRETMNLMGISNAPPEPEQ
jgi:hypothetical protein